jgi:hypothetical protein
MAKFIVDALADGVVTLRVPGTNYRSSFAVKGDAGRLPAVGQPVRGVIRAPAWKAEKVDLGGNYVEPLYGRPRRMQGSVLAVNAATNELTVLVGYEVVVKLPEKYQAASFPVGSRIGWDNVEMPTFEPGA